MDKKKFVFTLLADILIAGIVLCVFSYFHHVRVLWGISGDTGDTGVVIPKPEQPGTEPPYTADVDEGPGYDDSGQFGAKFGMLFAQDESEYVNTADTYKSRDIYITLSENHILVNDQPVQYFVYDIYVRNIENFYTSARMQGRQDFTEMLSELPVMPVAAVSGDFCGNSNAAREVVRNGEELRASDYITLDLCVLGWDGDMTTFTPSEYSHEAMLQLQPYQVWNFGPALVKDGQALTDFSARNDIGGRNPRIAVGMVEPGHYIFVCVDGRSDDSVGCKLGVLADICYQAGATEAYNLDGGASAHAYFNGEYIRYSDPDKSRNIYDVLCIGEISE